MDTHTPLKEKVEAWRPAPTPRRTLNLCMVSDDFLPAATGVGIHVQSVSKELARRGHRVAVLTTRRRGEPGVERWHGVQVHRTFTVKMCGFYQALPSRSAILRVLLENEIGIVHYHYLGYLLKRTRAITETMNVNNIYTYHMTADHLTQALVMRPFRPLIAKQIVEFCNGCDLVLAPSQKLVERIRRDGVTAASSFLSNPIEFSGGGAPVPKAGGTFVVLYAGRLHPEKNLPYLLCAFRGFARTHAAAELWIAGEGSERPRLEKLCRALGLEGRVKFLGFVKHEDLPRCYAAADVFVLPSLVETQGMVAMEAMRFALPVIVTSAIVSARELVEHGRNGFIVAPDSPADLTEKLALLCRDEALRREMGRQGLRKSGAFGVTQTVDRLEEHYFNLRPHAALESSLALRNRALCPSS